MYVADGYSGKVLIYEILSADLEVTKDDSADPVTPGTTLSYTLTVTNHGPSDASHVMLTDTLPPETIFVASTPGDPTCTEVAGVVTCDLGDLSFGESTVVEIDVEVVPSATGVLSNEASVSGDGPDPDPGNNGTVEETTVGPPICDLSVLKEGPFDPVAPGETLDYQISVANQGPSMGDGVVMTDALPPSVVFLSSTPPSPTCEEVGGTVTCTLGSLDSGASTDVTIEVMASLGFMGVVENTATVTGNDTDPNPANNSSTTHTTSTVLFADGFESGDCTAWSSMVP